MGDDEGGGWLSSWDNTLRRVEGRNPGVAEGRKTEAGRIQDQRGQKRAGLQTKPSGPKPERIWFV